MSGLVKQKEYNYKDSNVANLGSEEDKKVKKEAAGSETAWTGAGKYPGLQIWRINQFQVEKVDTADYGTFYIGDSYIVLHTYNPNEESEALEHDLYFWIGKDSTQDEYGTAAYKTVELDTFLDDKPVQHREVQNNESAEFIDLFKKNPDFKDLDFKFMRGGYESGFNKVTEMEFKTEFLIYKEMKNNKKVAYLKQIPLEKVWDKLIADYVFVLKTNDKIYVYNGSRANAYLKYAVHYALVKNLDIMQIRPNTPIERLDDYEVQAVFQEILRSEPGEDFDVTRKKTKEDTCDDKEPYLVRYKDGTFEEEARGDCIGALTNLKDGLVFLLILENKIIAYDNRAKEVSRHKPVTIIAQEYCTMLSKQKRKASIKCHKHEKQFLDQCKNV